MADKKNTLSLDYDAIWRGISRSTQVRDALEALATEVKTEAQRIAKQEAYDSGEYHDGIDVVLLPARQAKQEFARGYEKRKAAGQTVGANRFLDVDTKGDPDGGAYNGTIAVVTSRSWKSWIIEFGSLARNPSFVFSKVLASFRKDGVETQVTYSGSVVNQDLEAWRAAGGAVAVRIVGEKLGTLPRDGGGQA